MKEREKMEGMFYKICLSSVLGALILTYYYAQYRCEKTFAKKMIKIK